MLDDIGIPVTVIDILFNLNTISKTIFLILFPGQRIANLEYYDWFLLYVE